MMFTDRPLTGVGLGQYDENYQDYVAGLGIELRSEAREAHSMYLEVSLNFVNPNPYLFWLLIGLSLAYPALADREAARHREPAEAEAAA